MSSPHERSTAPTRWVWTITGGLASGALRHAADAVGRTPDAERTPLSVHEVGLGQGGDLAGALAATALREAQLATSTTPVRLCLVDLPAGEQALLVTTDLHLGVNGQRSMLDGLLTLCARPGDQEAVRRTAGLLAAAARVDNPPAMSWTLPGDRPRPPRPGQGARSVTRTWTFSPTTDAWCREHRVTPAQLILSGLTALLVRHGAPHDLALAVDLPADPGTDAVARGLRLRWTDTGTTADLTRAVAHALGTREPAHQCAPADCPVAFSWTDEEAEIRVGGYRAVPGPLDTGRAGHDLRVDALCDRRRIRLRLEYDTGLLAPDTAERLAERLETLGNHWPQNPRLATLTALTDEESRHVLINWQGAGAPLPEQSVHEQIAEWGRRRPQRPAVVCGGETLTYEELNARANRTARRLRELGARAEDRVAVMADRSVDSVVAVLGILKSGAGYVPVDPSYPPERIRYVLRDSGTSLLVGTHRTLAALPSAAGVHTVDLHAGEVARHDPAEPGPHAAPENLAYVIYTSGSTGEPKGVAVSHRSLAVSNAARRVGGDPPDTDLLTMPLCFDGSMSGMYWTLTGGGTLLLPTDAEVRDPRAVAALAATRPVTNIHSIPSYYALLLDTGALGRDRLPALRHVSVGGETLPPRLVEQHLAHHPEALLLNDYGPTEGTVWAAAHPCTPADAAGHTVPIGRPLPSYRLHVLDDGLRPVPPGTPGELCIGGPGVARGYLGRPALTAERFLPDPFSREPAGRIYRTGDRARQRLDGELEMLGRMDDQVKVRGFRVELGEIENVLLRHPEVTEAAVLLTAEPPGGPRLTAYVALSDSGVPVARLRSWLEETLPSYMCPETVRVLPALPRNHNGKVDTHALSGASRPVRGAGAASRAAAPGTRMADLTPDQVDALLAGLLRDGPAA